MRAPASFDGAVVTGGAASSSALVAIERLSGSSTMVEPGVAFLVAAEPSDPKALGWSVLGKLEAKEQRATTRRQRQMLGLPVL